MSGRAPGGLGFRHERPGRGSKVDWLTPPEIVAELGPFDLDPCAAVGQPWATARHHYTIRDDGLSLPWFGFVWCNPPFGPGIDRWLGQMGEHGHGIALVPARTETRWFVAHIWRAAQGLLFLHGRLKFRHITGEQAKGGIGTPIALAAYGREALRRLQHCSLKGTLATWEAANPTPSVSQGVPP